MHAQDRIRFEVGAGNKSQAVTSAAVLDTGWHHVVGTFASGVLKVYVDGALSSSATATFTAASVNNSQFQLGRAGNGSYYGGSLDEVAVYGSVLSAAQVADHYAKGVTTPPGAPAYTYDYSYDDDGRLTAKGTRSFVWNLADRLVSTSQGGTTAAYSYDGRGNRISGTVGAAVTSYTWDENGSLPVLVRESDGAGALLRRYVVGTDVMSMSTPAGVNYAHYDSVGSVTNTTNAAGVTQWARSFEPFGPKRSETNVSGSAPVTPLQYAGEYQDPTTSLLNLRARQYDPANGRFLSPDPLEAPFTNPYGSGYAYVGNNPLMFADPSGLTRQGVWAPFWDGVRFFGSVALSPLTDAASCLRGFFRWELETGACLSTALNIALIPVGGYAAKLLFTASGRAAARGVGGRLLLEETGTVTLGRQAAAKSETVGRTGWHAGDDIYATTRAGNEPAWSTVRARYWKNAGAEPGAAERYGAENVERMRRGLAPQRANPNARGGVESLELSHEPTPYRYGGRDLRERWPCEHAAVDPFRNPGYC